MQVLEAGLGDEGGESFAAEEFYVATVVEGIDVLVPTSGKRDGEIFQVAVVGRGADEAAMGFGGGEATGHEAAGVVEVLDDLGTVDEIEGLLVEVSEDIAVCGDDFEASGGAALAGDVDSGFGEIDADDGEASAGELGGDGAVAAADVEDAGVGG